MNMGVIAQELTADGFDEHEVGSIDSLQSDWVEVIVQCRKYEREENRKVRKALKKFKDVDHDDRRPIMVRLFNNPAQGRRFIKENKSLFGATMAGDNKGNIYSFADSNIRWNFFIGWLKQIGFFGKEVA